MNADYSAISNISSRCAAGRPTRTVRVAVLGAGQQAAAHLVPALLHVRQAKIAVIVDPVPGRRDFLADRHGVPARFSTVTEALVSGLVDCLVAACPPQAHERIIAESIAAGILLFVEKPPAASTAALADLVTAAQRRDVTTGVGMNFRWAAPVHRLRELIADDEAGGPSMLTIRHMAGKPSEPMWGLPLWRSFLLAQAIHPIDLVAFLVGAPVVEVAPACREADSSVWLSLQMHHSDGSISSVHCGNLAPRFEHRVEVSTTAGTTASLNGLTELTVAGRGHIGGSDARKWSKQWRPSPLDVGYDRTGFVGELAAFCAAVADAGQFSPSLADLLPSYAIMDQLLPTRIA
ncbi:Gfo/Idh/MocA family protein [Krasilnikovia sp. MM14-A1259]|uniref:Gfo/Idh/MocA family protein n=1 Tax=Krasilnikovia sp. MM14-A1259 TaxID=3373539 RepID=UPI00380F0A93